jgi:hypothetical protein
MSEGYEGQRADCGRKRYRPEAAQENIDGSAFAAGAVEYRQACRKLADGPAEQNLGAVFGGQVHVAHGLTDVIRSLVRLLDTGRPLRAFSLGSSSELQFRILESMF